MVGLAEVSACLSYGEVKTTLMHFVFNMTAISQA